MGGHIRGGLKAQNWGAGVCSGLRVPSLVPSGTLSFLNPSGLASVVLKHSNQVLPGVCVIRVGLRPRTHKPEWQACEGLYNWGGASSPYLFWWLNPQPYSSLRASCR